jgi:hypothetical protein
MEMKKHPQTLSFTNLITYDLHYEKYDPIFVEFMWYVMLQWAYALLSATIYKYALYFEI